MDNKDFEKLYRSYLKVYNRKDIKELQKEKIKLKSEIKMTLHPLIYLTALITVVGFFISNLTKDYILYMFIGMCISFVGIVILLVVSKNNQDKNKILTIKIDIINIVIKDKEKNNIGNQNIRQNKVKLIIEEKRKLTSTR